MDETLVGVNITVDESSDLLTTGSISSAGERFICVIITNHAEYAIVYDDYRESFEKM